MNVGIAFQVIDDNLDYTSNKSGKKIGIDLQEGKITLPLIIALNQCSEEERAFIQTLTDSQPFTEEAFSRVVKIIEQYHESVTPVKRRGPMSKGRRIAFVSFQDQREGSALCHGRLCIERRL